MYYIGPHVSIGGGVANAPKNAKALGATGFGMFVKNQRQWTAAPYTPADIEAFKQQMAADGYTAAQVMPHAGYLINLANPDEEAHAKSMGALIDEIRRCMALGLDKLNFHPGSHVGQGVGAGIALIATQLDAVMWPGMSTTVLLETMSGKGSEIGGTFRELREIIDRVGMAERLGVCFDTCHVHDAGYDIVGDLDGVLAEFDAVIGLERILAVHLNDSLHPRGSRKDRHARIGHGHIGLETFGRIVNHPALKNLPFYLETPNELPGYAEEIALLRRMWRG